MRASPVDVMDDPMLAAESLEHEGEGREIHLHDGEGQNGQGAIGESPNGAARIIEEGDLKGVLEALLFMAAEPIPTKRLQDIVETASKAAIERALWSLKQDMEQEHRGVQLVEIAGGYRIVTKAEFALWVRRLEKTKAAPKLSRSAMESLAIIAYKQPVVRAEIEQIRGVETSGVLRTLLERKLVRIVGRKEVPGRPIMYGTTKFFLEHFGLRDLTDLPPLREFKELGEVEQASLPMEDDDTGTEGRTEGKDESGQTSFEAHNNGLATEMVDEEFATERIENAERP